VDKLVDIAELQLDRGAHIVETRDARMLPDDFQAPFQLALVIVRHLQNEQVFKDIAIDHDLALIVTKRSQRSARN
jgi:hypothetical protein